MKKRQHICPHCKTSMKIRGSRQDHILVKTIYAQCENPECGASFKGSIEWTHQLSPSAIPDHNILTQLKTITP